MAKKNEDDSSTLTLIAIVGAIAAAAFFAGRNGTPPETSPETPPFDGPRKARRTSVSKDALDEWTRHATREINKTIFPDRTTAEPTHVPVPTAEPRVQFTENTAEPRVQFTDNTAEPRVQFTDNTAELPHERDIFRAPTLGPGSRFGEMDPLGYIHPGQLGEGIPVPLSRQPPSMPAVLTSFSDPVAGRYYRKHMTPVFYVIRSRKELDFGTGVKMMVNAQIFDYYKSQFRWPNVDEINEFYRINRGIDDEPGIEFYDPVLHYWTSGQVFELEKGAQAFALSQQQIAAQVKSVLNKLKDQKNGIPELPIESYQKRRKKSKRTRSRKKTRKRSRRNG